MHLYLKRVFTKTSNQVTRIDSTSKSPIYAYFDESLIGINTIRAYQCQARFTDRADAILNKNQQARYHVINAQRSADIKILFVLNLYPIMFRH